VHSCHSVLAEPSGTAQVLMSADVRVGNPSLSLGLAANAVPGFDDFFSALSSIGRGPYLSTQSQASCHSASEGSRRVPQLVVFHPALMIATRRLMHAGMMSLRPVMSMSAREPSADATDIADDDDANDIFSLALEEKWFALQSWPHPIWTLPSVMTLLAPSNPPSTLIAHPFSLYLLLPLPPVSSPSSSAAGVRVYTDVDSDVCKCRCRMSTGCPANVDGNVENILIYHGKKAQKIQNHMLENCRIIC